MQLQILEFPKVRERLATYAMFSASKELAHNLEPTPYYNEASTRLNETSEAVRLFSVKPEIGIKGARDVRPLAGHAQRGIILNADELTQIQQTLISARELHRILSKLAVDYPLLADIAYRIEACPGVVNRISQVIDERGEVRDNASPALNRIRREIEVVHGRLLEKLNKLVANPNYAHYLQETIVTQREGRYVVPLKASFKGKIRGVVHDQSSSGQTVFVEPLATVELNNKWRQLQLDELEEIRRILAELSALVAEHEAEISHTVSALADLDLAFAKAKYALAIEATAPELLNFETKQHNGEPSSKTAQRPIIKLIQARHPLLNPKTVVPLDIVPPDDTCILVITGPNTGGKTVSLKTVGLLAIMAQCGLWLPCSEGSQMPVFNHIFADIGDEQSIEQNLSTFSGHMTNIVHILEHCTPCSLVIFDELGAGTDPIEGSALARSILSHLLNRGVTTYVATHYSELKAYAHATSQVANASMAFDMESLAPTYRLLIGLPGASNAFTIGQRLGLFQSIINEARGLIGDDTKQIEAMLAEIKSQEEAAHQLRREMETQNQELQRRLDEIDTERKAILSSAREDARREIKTARQQIRNWQTEAEKTFELAKQTHLKQGLAHPKTVKTEQKKSTEQIEKIDEQLDLLDVRIEAKEAPAPVKEKVAPQTKRPIKPGDTVYIASYSTEGEVIAINRQQVEVQMGHFRTTVPLSSVERRQAKVEAPTIEATPINTPEIESPGMELDLRGHMAAEALHQLDSYLDKAFMARLPWVYIIHGKGSGTLRQAVRTALHKHSLITSHRSGDAGEGGEGVTVAKLAVS